MNYVESFDLFGVPAVQIPCIKESGAPTTATVGAVGCLYMDTDTGAIYKCVSSSDGTYTWVEEPNVADKASMEYVNDATTVNRTMTDYEYPLTITEGALIQNGKVVSFDAGIVATATVTPGDTIQVTGYQWVSTYGYHLYDFCDADGNVISNYASDVNSAMAIVTVTVPENAATIRVNGNPYNSKIAIVGECTKRCGIADAFAEIEALKGKATVNPKLITLGDSITALGTGNTGWVKYFIEKTGCELVANVAVNGAWLNDKAGTVYDGNPVFNGSDANVNNVLGNQVQKIINNAYDAPDIIMIAIGTNGGIYISKDQIKAAYYDDGNALIPLENVDRTTSAGAYRWCLEKLHETYPNALIFWCTPIHGYHTIRHPDAITNYAESLRVATEYTGQIMIDTIRCGINGINEVNGVNGQYLIDGLHPNANGAKKIGYYNASKVIPFLGNSFDLV